MIDRYPSPQAAGQSLALRAARIARLLGQDVPAADVSAILERARVRRRGRTADANGVAASTVPSFRVDVPREVDLIEEVGRHDGFDRLPTTFPALTAPQAPPAPQIARDRLRAPGADRRRVSRKR